MSKQGTDIGKPDEEAKDSAKPTEPADSLAWGKSREPEVAPATSKAVVAKRKP